jgi:gas vesicle protein
MSKLIEDLLKAVNEGKKEFKQEREKSGRSLSDDKDEILQSLTKLINQVQDNVKETSNKTKEKVKEFKQEHETKVDVLSFEELLSQVFDVEEGCICKECDCELNKESCDGSCEEELSDEFEKISALLLVIDDLSSQEIQKLKQGKLSLQEIRKIKTSVFYLSLLRNEIYLYIEEETSWSDVQKLFASIYGSLSDNCEDFDYDFALSILNSLIND